MNPKIFLTKISSSHLKDSFRVYNACIFSRLSSRHLHDYGPPWTSSEYHQVNLRGNYVRFSENDNHCSLIYCYSILETNRHDCVIEVAHGSPEVCLLCILVMHFDLIRVTKTIYKGKHPMISSSVNQHVNFREEKFLFGTFFLRPRK